MATDRGLVYERGQETFDDIGGQASFKQFLQGLFSGPRRPRLVVRWDEIDKSVSSAASGYFDVPTDKERAAIWKIQAKRFGLECAGLPDDAGWVGSDIRNCCQTAYMLNTSLMDAAQWITLVGRTARADIERLRDLAENLGFLSANQPGVYRRSKEINGRAIKL